MHEVPLGDALTAIIDHRGKTPKKLGGTDFTDSGVPVVSAIHIKSGRIQWNERRRFVPDWMFEKWMSVRLSQGDVLLTSEAPLGEVAQVENDAPLVLSQRLFALRGRPGVLDSTYLRYFLQSPDGRARLEARASGTTVMGIRQAELVKVLIPLPTLVEQKRVARLLATLDDLIEQNRALADDLAEIASTVGLRFMQSIAERPTRPLTDTATITRGFSYRSAELTPGSDTLVNLKNIGRGGAFERRGFKPLVSDRFKATQILSPGEVVVSMTDLTQSREVIARPVRVPATAANGRLVASLDLAIVRPKEHYTPEFLTAALAQDAFHSFAKAYCNGTTVLHMSVRAFQDYELPTATPSEVDRLTATLRALYAQQDACMAEVEDLIHVRDEILPLLMSGRVLVRDTAGSVA